MTAVLLHALGGEHARQHERQQRGARRTAPPAWRAPRRAARAGRTRSSGARGPAEQHEQRRRSRSSRWRCRARGRRRACRRRARARPGRSSRTRAARGSGRRRRSVRRRTTPPPRGCAIATSGSSAACSSAPGPGWLCAAADDWVSRARLARPRQVRARTVQRMTLRAGRRSRLTGLAFRRCTTPNGCVITSTILRATMPLTQRRTTTTRPIHRAADPFCRRAGRRQPRRRALARRPISCRSSRSCSTSMRRCACTRARTSSAGRRACCRA